MTEENIDLSKLEKFTVEIDEVNLTIDPSTLDLNERFLLLESNLNNEILERQHENHTAMLALISMLHHFTVGPPGLAKSLMVERLSLRIEDMVYFHWLLTKFTTPDEIVGGPDLKFLKDQGVLRRITDSKLPQAHVAFLDEIFKGSSAILNTLLTAMNERKFLNPGDDPKIPLMTIFGASNEIPDDEGLGAMWDRLHFRHVLEPIGSAANFKKMLTGEFDPNPAKILTLDDIRQANRESMEVHIGSDVLEAIVALRQAIRADNIIVTDRRWKESMKIIRAEAWLRGSDEVEMDDCRPLVHVLWGEEGSRRAIINHVLDMINPLDKAALELWEALRVMESDLERAILEGDNDRVKVQKCMEAFKKLQAMKTDYLMIKDSGRKTEYTSQAKDKFETLVGYLKEKIVLYAPAKS